MRYTTQDKILGRILSFNDDSLGSVGQESFDPSEEFIPHPVMAEFLKKALVRYDIESLAKVEYSDVCSLVVIMVGSQVVESSDELRFT